MQIDDEIGIANTIKDELKRKVCVLCGRGTTALWLALRAIARRDGRGEIIVPDILCSTVVEGALLAGFTPVFAPVLPRRYTLSADGVRQLLTPRTRGILVAHTFGHITDMDAIRKAAHGVPVIEDGVQGLGGNYRGQPVGVLGDVAFISFDNTKMVGGRGGALLFDDESLLEGVQADLDRLGDLGLLDVSSVVRLLPLTAAKAYTAQLIVNASTLLRRFDGSVQNVERISRDWQSLKVRVVERNDKGQFLKTGLSSLPLDHPELHDGDALWRYTIATPSEAEAGRIAHALQRAGLSGSRLYYPLSRFFGQQGGSGELANRLVNLWIDEATSYQTLAKTVETILALPRSA